MSQTSGQISGTALGGARAGFFRRLMALLVDVVVLAVVGFLLGKAFGQDVYTSTDGTLSYSLTGAPALLALLFGLAYYVYLEGNPGQTLGKKLLGIRVVDMEGGGAIGFGRAAIRYVGRLVSGFPLALGYFWMLWDKDKQTWHDKFANAIVVRTSANPPTA